MPTITITPAAFQAMKATLAKGGRSRPPQRDGSGCYIVEVDQKWLDILGRYRRKDESISDVIVRLASADS